MLQPQASGSVDATLIREQDAIKLEDAIRNVAGVNVGGYYSDWDYYRIRGFDASATTQLDGLTATPGIWMNEEVYGLERIEVLKGPASMLYGQTVLGGLVNMVSKKPKLGSHGEGTLSGGTENFFEVGADAGTSLAEDAVGIRAVAMARNRGSWVDGVDDSRRWYVAPSLSWWIAETTTLTVLANIVDDDINAAWPLPAAGFVTSNPNGELPLDRNIGEPGTQNHVERTRASIGYEVAHRFSDMLELRQHARLSDYDSEFLGIYAGSLDPDQRTLNRDVYAYESTRLDVQIDTLLQADFATGSVPHTAVLGLDWRQGEETGFGEFAAIAPLDLFDPDYGAEPGALSAYTDTWIRELFPATAMAKP
jgi:iron complex outermembrane receptor protein